jgi:hypothetical protein
LGQCKLSHSDELKRQYEEARKTKDYGYELDLYRQLDHIIAEVDRKMKNAQKRLEHQQKEQFPELAVINIYLFIYISYLFLFYLYLFVFFICLEI